MTRLALIALLGALAAGCEPLAGSGAGAVAETPAAVESTGPAPTVIGPGEVVPTDGPGETSLEAAGEGGDESALGSLDG